MLSRHCRCWSSGPNSRNDSIIACNAIGSSISRQLLISRSGRNDPALIGSRSQRFSLLRGSVVDQKFYHSSWFFYQQYRHIYTLHNAGKLYRKHVLSCVNNLQIFNEVNHMHVPVEHDLSKAFCDDQRRMRALHWLWRSRIDTHEWSCHIPRVISCCISMYDFFLNREDFTRDFAADPLEIRYSISNYLYRIKNGRQKHYLNFFVQMVRVGDIQIAKTRLDYGGGNPNVIKRRCAIRKILFHTRGYRKGYVCWF